MILSSLPKETLTSPINCQEPTMQSCLLLQRLTTTPHNGKLLLTGANSSWFHLFRMLVTQHPISDEASQETASTMEQFLQTASLGEFERRLELIATFRSVVCPCIAPARSACKSECSKTDNFGRFPSETHLRFSKTGTQQEQLSVACDLSDV